jgi:hypothetical protein
MTSNLRKTAWSSPKVRAQLVGKKAAIRRKYLRPVSSVYLMTDEMTRTVREIENQRYKGIGFSVLERAGRALAKMYQHPQWFKEVKECIVSFQPTCISSQRSGWKKSRDGIFRSISNKLPRDRHRFPQPAEINGR